MSYSARGGFEREKGVAAAGWGGRSSGDSDWQTFTSEVQEGTLSSLPFPRFLEMAIMHNLHSLIDGGAHLSPLWEFARALKARGSAPSSACAAL